MEATNNWPDDADVVVLTERQLLSRLLYPNPVCLLCTPGTEDAGAVQLQQRNVQDTKKSCQQLIIHYCPFPLTIDLLFSAEYDVCMAGSCGNYAQRLI